MSNTPPPRSNRRPPADPDDDPFAEFSTRATNTPSTGRTSASSAKPPARAKNDTRRPAPAPKRERGGSRIGLGVIVFIGTLLGSLLGIAADAGGAVDTFERIRSAFNPELCIAGSNTILGEGITMAADWAEAFEAQENVRVRVEGVGSVRGVEKAINGDCVHVLAMSEPMTITQYNALRGANVDIDCAAEIGYDVIAFVTDIDNRLPALLSRSLSGILRGQISDWGLVNGTPGAIRVLARPGSGTTEVVLRNVAQWQDEDLNDNQYFPPGTNFTPCGSNEDCLNQTLATPGSLYWVSTAWMRTQPERFLRVMPILRGDERPINPLTQAINLDEYPSSLIRPLYFYVLKSDALSDEMEAMAREFLAYARSVPGQVILERHHFYAFFNRPMGVEVELPPGFEPRADGLRPVCRT
jgi:ABC-type phosphate transport system substrate-binding protein